MGANPAVCHSDAGCQAGCHSRAGLEAADGDDFVQGPNSNSEGAGSAAENGTGAVIERLERWDDATTTDSDGGAERSLAGSLLGSWALELCLGSYIAAYIQGLYRDVRV